MLELNNIDLILIVSSLIFILLRLFIRLKKKYFLGTDHYFHLIKIKILKQNNRVINSDFARTTLGAKDTYPFLYDFIMSFLSTRSFIILERILSPLIDCFCFIISWIILKLFFFQINIEIPSVYVMFIIASLYIFSPVLNHLTGTFRNYHGNARVFSQFIFFIILSSFIFYNFFNLTFFILFVIVFTLLLPITSKFSNQVIFFLILGLIITSEFKFLICILVGLILSILLFGKNFVSIILGQIKHSVFYYKVLQKQLILNITTGGTYLNKLINFIISTLKKPSFSSFYWLIDEENLIHRLLIHHLLLIPIYFITYKNFDIILIEYEFLTFLLKLQSIFLFISILTYINKFKFLGEYYRYLEFFIFFEILLFSLLSLLFNPYLFYFFSIIYLILGIISYFCSFTKSRTKTFDLKKNEELISSLQKIDKNDTLLYCLTNLFWITLYHTKRLKIPFYFGNCHIDEIGENKMNDLYGGKTLKPTKNFNYLKKKYKITHVISSNEDFSVYRSLFNKNLYKKIIHRGKFYIIVRL